ncbi:hypothetical protein FBY35_6829 [Streptomyces sp. SLBN-118]|nr:hypothetical protein FBY35_6829 [Streptomyces sp. SLBN-118]
MLSDVNETTASHGSPGTLRRPPRIHRAWFVAIVTFVAIIGAAAFASLPGLLIEPLHEEFAW